VSRQITSLLIDQRVAVLLQLSHPDHRVGVDLYSGKEVRIAPVVGRSGRAAQLDLYTLLHQPGEELSVRIPGLNGMTGLNMTISVVGVIIEYEVGGVSVKDSNNLAFDVPILEVRGE